MAENDVRSRWIFLLKYNQECQSLGKTSASMSLGLPDSEIAIQNILNTWNWEWKTMQA